jgi:hypothetical protein
MLVSSQDRDDRRSVIKEHWGDVVSVINKIAFVFKETTTANKGTTMTVLGHGWSTRAGGGRLGVSYRCDTHRRAKGRTEPCHDPNDDDDCNRRPTTCGFFIGTQQIESG